MTMNYREYKEGDTIRVTGCQGRLFSACGDTELNNGVKLGVECVLVEGEDAEHDVKLPKGILFDDDVYISVACIELVQAVEDKTAVLEHIDVGRHTRLFSVSDPISQKAIAQIWHDTDFLPEEVAKAFAEAIKAVYDSIERRPIDKKERPIKLFTTSNNNGYHEYREGDTVRITGEQGRLFNSGCDIELKNGVKLGVKCVLVKGENNKGDVRIPSGALGADGYVYISAKCIELVKAVEDKTAIIEHIGADLNSHFFISDSTARYAIASIWSSRLPEEVAKAFAEAIKAAYDSIVTSRKTNS